jgi:hypothetical protein
MAGSWEHCLNDDGSFRFNLIENMRDAHEACEHMFWLVRMLAGDLGKARRASDEYFRRKRDGDDLTASYVEDTPRRPDAPAWAVGDRAVWLSDKYEDATEVEVLAVGPELLAVKFVDAPEGRPFCTRPATLRRPAPKRRKVVVQREYRHKIGSLRWIEEPAGVGHMWEPTGRAHEFEVDE